MIQEYQVRVLPQVAANEQSLRMWLADEYGFDVRTVTSVRILRRSIDARQRTIFVNLKVRVYINEQPQGDEYVPVEYPDVSDKPQVIVVGAGPGGLFAALRLIELGLRPIVLERGKDVHERKKDLSQITKTQQVDPESNYCFGEGGAGAYSDGKLYTRSKKRGSIEKILNVFCQHGASTNILADAHPHIGTDKLPRVIENMRNTILKSGGEVHFQTKMTSLILEGNRVVGCLAAKTLNSQLSTIVVPSFLPLVIVLVMSIATWLKVISSWKPRALLLVCAWSTHRCSSTRYNTITNKDEANTCQQQNTRLSLRLMGVAFTASACVLVVLSFLLLPTSNRLWSMA